MNVAVTTRKLAIDAVHRADAGGAYANLVVPQLLNRTPLNQRDRAFVTELAYGTTRMRRACDWLIDRYLMAPVEPIVRAALRVGAYQLAFLDMPAHAAVNTTVSAAPTRARKLVNAVLRKIAAEPGERQWPDEATQLSYPDWIVERLVAELGPDEGRSMLAKMNEPAKVTLREDGYVQDSSSQLVAALVGAQAGELVADVCAAPGGKATLLARSARLVIASDVRAGRLGLIRDNCSRLELENVVIMRADACALPFPDRSLDRVLVDAPCSGLGALRRRPDARWRIEPADVERLAALQARMLAEAARVVRPGGAVVYSVCTLTDAETVAVDTGAPETLVPAALPSPWRPRGRGGQLLPHDDDGDGMFAVLYHRI